MFVESVSSPITDFMTPILPLSAPFKHREMTRPVKERERPKEYMLIDSPSKPTRITGLRPMRSDMRDQ